MCASNLQQFTQKGEVVLIDSMSKSRPTRLLILQIAEVFQVTMDSEYLRVKQLNVQQQEGVVDCGLFAIAFAAQMCYKRNPSLAIFDQSKMRKHLFDSIIKGEITPFPQQSQLPLSLRPLPLFSCPIFSFKVYCYCRLTDDYDTDMIQCIECDKWLHFACVGVLPPVDHNLTWKCPECRGLPCTIRGKPLEFT